MKSTLRFMSLSACLIVVSLPGFLGAADTGAVSPPKPDTSSKPAEDTLAASLAISAKGVTALWLGVDRRSRATRRVTSWNPGVRFGLKLEGPGPVYRKFEVHRHGAATSSVPHEGTVTIDPKQQWVVIDLQEVMSKPGEPRRTEPCAANGRYPVESISSGTEPLTDRSGLTPGSGPTPAELAVHFIPNGPPMQPK